MSKQLLRISSNLKDIHHMYTNSLNWYGHTYMYLHRKFSWYFYFRFFYNFAPSYNFGVHTTRRPSGDWYLQVTGRVVFNTPITSWCDTGVVSSKVVLLLGLASKTTCGLCVDESLLCNYYWTHNNIIMLTCATISVHAIPWLEHLGLDYKLELGLW